MHACGAGILVLALGRSSRLRSHLANLDHLAAPAGECSEDRGDGDAATQEWRRRQDHGQCDGEDQDTSNGELADEGEAPDRGDEPVRAAVGR